jgi:hypothetical protein
MSRGVSEAPKRLRLVSEAPRSDTDALDLAGEVRATRRSVARFLRALHASGHAIASWPESLITRLAHADAVTARFLLEPERVDPEQATAAASSLRTIELWIIEGLGGSERARLRSFELAIRIDADELARPLLQLERPLDAGPTEAVPRSVARVGTLKAGLAALDQPALAEVGRRLGLARRFEGRTRVLALVRGDRTEVGSTRDSQLRRTLEHDIVRVLRDEHLLAILVATLAPDALDLLAALVRGTCSDERLIALASAPALAVGGGPRSVGPGDALQQCGLAFSTRDGAQGIAVPPELRGRLDGVLQTLGV